MVWFGQYSGTCAVTVTLFPSLSFTYNFPLLLYNETYNKQVYTSSCMGVIYKARGLKVVHIKRATPFICGLVTLYIHTFIM